MDTGTLLNIATVIVVFGILVMGLLRWLQERKNRKDPRDN